MRIALVHGNDGSDVRVGKLCRSLSRLGHDTHFVGWDRRPEEEKQIDLGGAASHIMISATKRGRATLFGQLRFALYVVKTLGSLRPSVVSCVNEDTAFLALPLKRISFDYLVCDVFDSLVDRHSNRNRVIRSILGLISRIVRKRADRIIVTDEARLSRVTRYREKCDVIQNYPEDPGQGPAMDLPTGVFKIFVGGTLHQGRGLKQILAVVDELEGFKIIAAGWIYDDFADREFRRHPRVEYKGILTANQSLRIAAHCDAILAFYEPTSTNNIYASPNKLFDAMSVGRPIIINSETRISNWVLKERLGWACEYFDVAGLTAILRHVAAHRDCLEDFATGSRKKFVSSYSWESLQSKIDNAYSEF